jgi:rhomboid family GlyGly-CTERM serine protease
MSLRRLGGFHIADLAPALLLAAVLVAVQLAAAGNPAGLRYERSAVLAGEAWRLITGHLVHGDAAHLGWNLLGVALVGLLFGRGYRPWQWLAVLAAALLVIDLGFLLLEPQLAWYVGFSGALHGLMAAGLVAWLWRARDAVTWLVAAIFCAKLAWEHAAGPLPFTAESMSLPVVHAAHTYGAVGGALAGLWLTHRTAAAASL